MDKRERRPKPTQTGKKDSFFSSTFWPPPIQPSFFFRSVKRSLFYSSHPIVRPISPRCNVHVYFPKSRNLMTPSPQTPYPTHAYTKLKNPKFSNTPKKKKYLDLSLSSLFSLLSLSLSVRKIDKVSPTLTIRRFLKFVPNSSSCY